MTIMKINPTTNKLDLVLADDDLDGVYVRIIGDTMTGPLVISPSSETSLTSNKDIILKSGRRLVFDGS